MLVVALTAMLVVQGCGLFARHYPDPPQPLRPKIAGIVASATDDATGSHVRLVDGRTVDIPRNGTYQVIGGPDVPGRLLLAGVSDGGFATGLDPLGNGCWEAYQGPSDHRMVWDMGAAILFMTGIELPKAPGFVSEVPSQDLDGRQGWYFDSDGGDFTKPITPTSFCANVQGEVESARLLPPDANATHS